MTTECALMGWARHRLLGNIIKPPTKSQLDGRMWHAAIMGEAHDVVRVDADNFKMKDAREARDEALAEGKIPVAAPVFDSLAPAVDRIHEELRRYGIDITGATAIEELLEWSEYATGGVEVLCSGYLDVRWNFAIRDLKTGPSCTSVSQAMRQTADSHSLLQEPAYRRAVAQKHGVDFERTAFEYLFIQTQEPFCITPVPVSGQFRAAAEMRWQRAVDLWAECLSNGTDRHHWPGPQPYNASHRQSIDVPQWTINAEIEIKVAGDE